MATKTEIYELRKKEENDFYNIEDFNNNMDTLEKALTEFDDSGTAEGVTSFPEMLTKLVTGNKLAITLKNLKAGLQFVLHAGSIVNNCVTDNANLPVSAAMAKSLQDQINQANSNLGHFQYAVIKSKQSHTFNVNATCWFVLHGNTDQNGSLFAGDVRGRLYTLCGGDSSTNVLVSYDDGKLTITNNINWAEVFIVFG